MVDTDENAVAIVDKTVRDKILGLPAYNASRLLTEHGYGIPIKTSIDHHHTGGGHM